jgi:hypothetical protein
VTYDDHETVGVYMDIQSQAPSFAMNRRALQSAQLIGQAVSEIGPKIPRK